MFDFLHVLCTDYTETIASNWRGNMLGYLSLIRFSDPRSEQFSELERGSRKILSFEEHIMSKDKYPSIFSKLNGGCCD